MIVTNLDQLAEQTVLPRAVIDMVHEVLRQTPAEGRIDVDGDKVFALVSAYESVTDSRWRFEGHQKYLDIQYVASGQEIIGWAPRELVTITVPYNHQSDVWFGTVPSAEITALPMPAGRVAIFYPDDAHAPGRACTQPEPVLKVVFKIALACLPQAGRP